MHPIPHDHCYWLPNCRVLAGDYPYSLNSAAGLAKLRRILDAGVTTFIDLTERRELEPYEPALRAEAEARGLSVEYVRLPIRDMGVPPPGRMREVLDAIDAACAAGRTAYVHCWGGIGRTGTVVGCHLVRGGLTGDQALARVRELFGGMPAERDDPYPGGSPQTDEQRDYVRRWREGGEMAARNGDGG